MVLQISTLHSHAHGHLKRCNYSADIDLNVYFIVSNTQVRYPTNSKLCNILICILNYIQNYVKTLNFMCLTLVIAYINIYTRMQTMIHITHTQAAREYE